MGAVINFPILSVITWAPFVSAVLIMFAFRHRPLAVRWTAAIGTGISLVLSIWLYAAYDRTQAGFQFSETVPLVPSLGI
jgi:NADH-quinone oxidoreductase subunit M